LKNKGKKFAAIDPEAEKNSGQEGDLSTQGGRKSGHKWFRGLKAAIRRTKGPKLFIKTTGGEMSKEVGVRGTSEYNPSPRKTKQKAKQPEEYVRPPKDSL